MIAENLSALPAEVRESAVVDANGEVSWPIGMAAAAIAALADASLVILGLDVRRIDNLGRVSETAWSSFEPAGAHDRDVVAGRNAALAALSHPEVSELGDWILVTWR